MYRYRRPWRGRNIIWLMIFPTFFMFSHWGLGIIAWLFLMMAIFMIVRGVSRTWSNPTPTYQPPYQPYQPYQRQQPNDYYQPMNGYQYPSYQQGYQEHQAQEVHDAQPQQVVQQDEPYEQYEQPQAQYPQELPPMQ
jgi:hypothetical protein